MSDDAAVFRLLQVHLDQQPVGFPAASSGADIRLLKKLFSPDEAAIALHLSFRPASLAEVVERAGPEYSGDQVRALLDGMLQKGAIGWRERGGVDQWFVQPLIVGMFETVQAGVPAPGFLAEVGPYLQAGRFVKAFLTSRPTQVRVVPIHESIPVEHHVATYDRLRSLVQAAPGPFVVLKCVCREMSSSIRSQPCKKTSRLETCLALDDLAAATLRRGHGRQVSREEFLGILARNEADGLVLQTTNAQRPEFVCACCGCCCGLLSLQKKVPRPADFWAGNYRCTIDAEACSSCGDCVSRCQVGAMGMTAPGGAARIDLGRCIGCGVCVPSCPTGALALKRKEPAAVPSADLEALHEEILVNKRSRRRPPGGAKQ